MSARILPVLDINCTALHCGRCSFLRFGETAPLCELFTGELAEDIGGARRADECIDAEERASANIAAADLCGSSCGEE